MEYELLATLSEADRRAVLSKAARRRFKRGEVIFHEGDLGDTFHHIAKGRVAIRVSTPTGDVATVAVMDTGEAFGEGALLEPDMRRSATAVALEATETLVLARSQFDELRRNYPLVDDLLIQHLAKQVRRLTRHMVEAMYVPADKRVLRRLLELNDIYRGEAIPLTQEDLAAMAGTTRPTANRALQVVADLGLIEVARGRVRVLDAESVGRRCR